MKSCLVAGAMALACLIATPAAAQNYPQIVAPSNVVPPQGVAFKAADGSTNVASPTTPLPVATRVEAFQLATANTAAPPVALVGGSYIWAQGCTGYGSVALRYRGPDGATMVTMVTKTAADSAGGTLVQLGGGAIVDVALSGTTGCSVSLTRVPQ